VSVPAGKGKNGISRKEKLRGEDEIVFAGGCARVKLEEGWIGYSEAVPNGCF